MNNERIRTERISLADKSCISIRAVCLELLARIVETPHVRNVPVVDNSIGSFRKRSLFSMLAVYWMFI